MTNYYVIDENGICITTETSEKVAEAIASEIGGCVVSDEEWW